MATDRQLELLLKLLVAESQPVTSRHGAPQAHHRGKHAEPRDTRQRHQHRK